MAKYEIISKEYVKPCSPTPHHLRVHKLSLLDQISPTFLFPTVLYFFPSPQNYAGSSIPQKTQILKHSLSAVLTRFYPLAGRINHNYTSVDCNDEGVPFTVCNFKQNLSDFLTKPEPIITRVHIPGQPPSVWADPDPTGYVAMIQITHFACGGIAIGSIFSHAVIDGMTAVAFLRAWADTARGHEDATDPIYDVAQSLFPQHTIYSAAQIRDESRLFLMVKNRYLTTGKTAMRRYVFASSAIAKLKKELTICSWMGPDSLERPTRVEMVSAFIWKCFMNASIANNKKMSLVRPVVNIRRRASPPFPENCFGNFIWAASASCTNQSEVGLKQLVSKIRKSIGKISAGFIKEMMGNENFSGFSKNVEETLDGFPETADCLVFSSWCNFGLYDIDFGSGKAVWVVRGDAGSDSEISFMNQVWLMDTRDGDGIEAWVTLDQKYMAIFDSIQELRAMASIDPTPPDNIYGISKCP